MHSVFEGNNTNVNVFFAMAARNKSVKEDLLNFKKKFKGVIFIFVSSQQWHSCMSH